MSAAVEIVRPGPLALIQDEGRFGYAHLAVPRSGAADRRAYADANRLVGNGAGAAVIECAFGGLALRARGDLVLAVTGAPAPLTVDRASVPHATAVAVAGGQTVLLRTPPTGVRSYLAVRGGFDVPAVLGSRSTDTLSGLGPAPLAAGSLLAVGPAPLAPEPHDPAPTGRQIGPSRDAAGVLRVLWGPRDDWLDNAAELTAGEWIVSRHSNRVGVRLLRPDAGGAGHRQPLRRGRSRELPSEGMVLGAIQVPPDGEPVLFLADHPVTGGYPVVAVVVDDDIDLAAQCRPGDRLRFRDG